MTTLPAAADSYVRDGRHAVFNFGSAGTLAVKNETGNYNRIAYLKFDLSSINGAITSAKLKLMPVSVGRRLGMVHLLYATATDNWTEADVNWNNKPAMAGLLASWSVPETDNTPVEIDITGAVSGRKVLSLAIRAAADYGQDGAVDYASNNHHNAKYRPVLVVTTD